MMLAQAEQQGKQLVSNNILVSICTLFKLSDSNFNCKLKNSCIKMIVTLKMIETIKRVDVLKHEQPPSPLVPQTYLFPLKLHLHLRYPVSKVTCNSQPLLDSNSSPLAPSVASFLTDHSIPFPVSIIHIVPPRDSFFQFINCHLKTK